MCSRSLYLRAERNSAMVTNDAIMQQTITFENRAQERRSIDVLATIRRSVKSLNKWLDGKSEFYSRMLGESITWRKGLRIGVVLPCLFLVVLICTIQAPFITATCLASAGWLVYRLNQEDEKGGNQ